MESDVQPQGVSDAGWLTEAERLRARWRRPFAPWATLVITGLCLRFFLWPRLTGTAGALSDAYSRDSLQILEAGEIWRLFTYSLLHGSLEHISMNLLFIVVVGVTLERLFGPATLLALYVASVVVGGALSVFGSPDAPSIGASAGDFGLLAAAVVVSWRYAEAIPRAAKPVLSGFLVVFTLWGFTNGLLSRGGIDNAAHFGGMLTGGALALALRPAGLARARSRNRLARVGSLLGVGGLVAGLWGLGARAIPLETVTADGLEAACPAWWEPAWLPDGTQGRRSGATGAACEVHSVEREQRVSLAQAREALEGALRGVDPSLGALTALDDAPAAPTGTPHGGGRLRLRGVIQLRSGPQQVDALLLARGRFLHRVVIFQPLAHTGRLAPLVERLLARVTLRPPKAAAEIDATFSPDAWRARLARAAYRVRIGEDAGAREDLDAALRLAPDEPLVAERRAALLAEMTLRDVTP